MWITSLLLARLMTRPLVLPVRCAPRRVANDITGHRVWSAGIIQNLYMEVKNIHKDTQMDYLQLLFLTYQQHKKIKQIFICNVKKFCLISVN